MESKIAHVVNVIFSLLVIFALVGSVVKPGSMMPATVLVFTVLGWASGRIVRDGTASIKALFSKGE